MPTHKKKMTSPILIPFVNQTQIAIYTLVILVLFGLGIVLVIVHAEVPTFAIVRR